MVRVEKLIVIWLLIILILTAIYSHEIVFAQTRGPRTEDLVINFYGDIGAAYNALKAGVIDIVGYEITRDQYADAVTDPDIVVGPVGDRGKYQFDLNNNYTATDLNDGRRNPCSYVDFRRGIAFCVDKDLIVDTFCEGFADRIDQPLAYMQRGWRNTSYWYEDGTYPYEYNLISASAAFDAAGFVQGSESNPNYDSGVPGSAPNLRIHPEKGSTMNLLEVCVRIDDTRMLEAGRALCDALRLVGIPVNQIEADSSILYPKVMDNFNYQVYTGGWSPGRFPGISAFSLYHSSQYFLGGANYVTGNDSLGNPAHPTLDAYLYGARYPNNYSEALDFARKAFGQHIEKCVTIELFSAKSYWGWSSDLLGVVNAEGCGLENGYTFMNAYKIDGSPIRYGLRNPPNAMNKIYSAWYYDYQCLDRMDLYGGLEVPPYDYSNIQAGFVSNWTMGTYQDPDDSENKTVVTWTIQNDAWFVEPVTGNPLEQVNVTHLYASIWLHLQAEPLISTCPYCLYNIKTLRMKDPFTLEFYWNDKSYWNIYHIAKCVHSFNWFSKGTISLTVTETLTADEVTGYLSCTHPVFYVLSVETQGGEPLLAGIDYDIYGTGTQFCDWPCADVRILNEAYLGANISLTYLALDFAGGYYTGGAPWQESFEGAGIYYAVDFMPGAGGYLSLKRNPYYLIETPPLGEVDFVKKTTGCYKVDIFDVVMAATAYGSQGVSEPDSNWLAGADLAYPGGQIDIFDIVTVASNYGTVWDCYPSI